MFLSPPQNLSKEQVELAFRLLYNPNLKSERRPVPPELEHLNEVEWQWVSDLLVHLLRERQHSPLH